VRAVVQRVTRAGVTVDGERIAAIERGLLVLLGVAQGDTEAMAIRLAGKVASLRIFEDNEGRMNLGLGDVGGRVLCVSQFTLYGDIRRGNRPSFTDAAPPAIAEPLYEAFCRGIEATGLACARGQFGAHMAIELVNDGPVTLMIDSADFDRPRRA
jgi:D-aminoacyl-tRNA deacylase